MRITATRVPEPSGWFAYAADRNRAVMGGRHALFVKGRQVDSGIVHRNTLASFGRRNWLGHSLRRAGTARYQGRSIGACDRLDKGRRLSIPLEPPQQLPIRDAAVVLELLPLGGVHVVLDHDVAERLA